MRGETPALITEHHSVERQFFHKRQVFHIKKFCLFSTKPEWSHYVNIEKTRCKRWFAFKMQKGDAIIGTRTKVVNSVLYIA